VIRLILMGVWASLITIASSFAAIHFRQAYANKDPGAPPPALETRKTKEINVPKVRDGVVKGYVIMQFSYVVDFTASKKTPLSPDPFVVDEAFRQIYDDDSIDFAHLEKVDLHALAQSIVRNANVRLKTDVLTDIAFHEFTFMPYAEAKPPM
jgi:hypothetical protein